MKAKYLPAHIRTFCLLSLISASFISCYQKGPKNISQGELKESIDTSKPEAFYEDNAKIIEEAEQQTKALEIAPAVIVYDYPIEQNERVDHWLNYFQGKGRRSFKLWMERSGQYKDMIHKTLTDYDLPQDLLHLSMIESGFRPDAYSHAKASGMWQFIYSTGKKFGLTANHWIDERRDPIKATKAAAQYLKTLHAIFNDWQLASAAYNAGEGKILRAIKKHDTRDFWEMTRHRYLKQETKDYVPKIIAATMIARNPSVYGFENIQYQAPLNFEYVSVDRAVELSTIAKYLKISHKTLKKLNPELLRGVTPPKQKNYQLKVPVGSKSLFISSYNQIKQHKVNLITKHKVRRGDVLSKIAKRYGVSYSSIMRVNKMNSTRIRAGQSLIIPRKMGDIYANSAIKKQSSKSARKVKKTYSPAQASNKIKPVTHTVKQGESLWTIAKNYQVNIGQLKEWNALKSKSTIYSGQKLSIGYHSISMQKGGRWILHKVQSGESLWSIAKKYGIAMDKIIAWNKLNPKNVKLFPGNTLKIKAVES